VTNATQN